MKYFLCRMLHQESFFFIRLNSCKQSGFLHLAPAWCLEDPSSSPHHGQRNLKSFFESCILKMSLLSSLEKLILVSVLSVVLCFLKFTRRNTVCETKSCSWDVRKIQWIWLLHFLIWEIKWETHTWLHSSSTISDFLDPLFHTKKTLIFLGIFAFLR